MAAFLVLFSVEKAAISIEIRSTADYGSISDTITVGIVGACRISYAPETVAVNVVQGQTVSLDVQLLEGEKKVTGVEEAQQQ